MKHTENGWQTDYRNHYGKRVRDLYQSREEAIAAEAVGKRYKNYDRNNHKLGVKSWNPAALRCGQKSASGKRCRRIATAAHRENGKLTCPRHQARNFESRESIMQRAREAANPIGY